MPSAPRHVLATALLTIVLGGCASAPSIRNTDPDAVDRKLQRIQHVIVIYAENRSFDNLYGLFPGANGIANAPKVAKLQLDHDGTPMKQLPLVWRSKASGADPKFPTLPNAPFRIDASPINLPLSQKTRDLVHQFYQNQEQIADGRMNHFAEVSNAGGLTMGYYDGSPLPMWKLAREFTLSDNFFMGAFGGSFLNHFWFICACTPVFPNAPAEVVAQLDAQHRLKRQPNSPASALDGPAVYLPSQVTVDGYAVNTTQPPFEPSGIPPASAFGSNKVDPNYADPGQHPLPPQTAKTIGDTLSAKGISWAWYAGAWNAAVVDGVQPPTDNRKVIYIEDNGAPNFQPHHQPFNYFARFAPGTRDRAEHLKDGGEFLDAIDRGTLPQVSFYKPQGNLNSHPGYADVLSGDQHVAAIVERIRRSPLWSSSLVIVTYDENGGFWDHVAPPKGDRWGPGVRIPAIIISPFARRGYVDHTLYDTTSVIKLLTRRFHLEPLPGVRSNVGDLTGALAP
jgi:acid phosphatase